MGSAARVSYEGSRTVCSPDVSCPGRKRGRKVLGRGRPWLSGFLVGPTSAPRLATPAGAQCGNSSQTFILGSAVVGHVTDGVTGPVAEPAPQGRRQRRQQQPEERPEGRVPDDLRDLGGVDFDVRRVHAVL